MKIRRQLVFTLAAVIWLASGCSRSLATPSGSSAILSTVTPTTAQVLTASPTLQPDLHSFPSGPGSSATSTPSTLPQNPTEPASSYGPTPDATATRSRQPSLVSDLLYISQDRLMRWDPLTRHAISLAQNVTDFAVSPDGQVIVLLRPQKITANGVQQFDLDVLRLEDQQIYNLLDNTSQPEQLIISPTGSHLAFSQELAEGVSIFILQVAPQNEPQKVGVCQPGSAAPCVSLAWSPTGHDLLWSDARGLWQTSADSATKGDTTQLIHPNKVTVKDPKGQNVEIEAHFTDLQFAPSERFILLKVIPLSSAVGWQAVFDRRTGQIAQASDTFVTGEDQSQALWASNGNLLVAHTSEPGRQIPPFIHVWMVMPTNSELLVSGQQFDLYSDNFPFSTAQSKAVPSHRLHWLAETQPDHLTFAVQLDPSDDPPVLFDLNMLSGSLTMLYELPADTTRVLWSPDGHNALVLGGRNQVASFSLKTGELSDLQPILGLDAHRFVWMPPALRR